jgi:monoamine oxidase
MVLIIGGGLSGLVTACQLKSQGIPFKILESRDRLGGRIHTIYNENQAPVEIGATWFTSDHRHLINLLGDLSIPYFNQQMGSTAFYQANPSMPTQLVAIPDQSPSYRIAGGSSQLINRLVQQLDPEDILLNQTVSEIRIREKDVEVIASSTFMASRVVLALPPKLWSHNIKFYPELHKELKSLAMTTHTWMENSIKVAVNYREPFWENNHSAGTLFTHSGPITEFYDHSNRNRTTYALCGFVRSDLSQENPEERKTNILKQLEQIYGAQASSYLNYTEKVWSSDENTFVSSESHLAPHQNNGHPAFAKAIYNRKILISSSETASEFPGYMDGAINAGKRVAQIIADYEIN